MENGLVHGDKVPREYESLVEPHIASFDFFLEEGLESIVEHLQPIEVEHPITKKTHRIWLESPTVGRPLQEGVAGGGRKQLYPRDCREGGGTYKAPFTVDLCYAVDDDSGGEPRLPQRMTRNMGNIPVMIRSKACYLRNMNRAQLVAHKEESTEMGGYFICNGIERLIRLLVQQRRHYIMALRRAAYKKRGNMYTDEAVVIRCVRPDEYSSTVRLHHLTDGTANFALTIRREEFFIPAGILLRAFTSSTDLEIHTRIKATAFSERFDAVRYSLERTHMMLAATERLGLHTRGQCLGYLGSHFRAILDLPRRWTDQQCGKHFLKEHIFVHLTSGRDKQTLLLAMIAKLYAFVQGQCSADNPDALTNQEVLLPGLLLMKFVKEQLEQGLEALKQQIRRDLERHPEAVNLQDEKYMSGAVRAMSDIGKKMEYMLNTGNLVSRGGLDLSQTTGFTVVAEKLNFYRYFSHFRAVHRGAFFAELRTTTVRKLLPESWGFFCPVHTPDGAPCGLLNHLAAECRAVSRPSIAAADPVHVMGMVLMNMGMYDVRGNPPPRGMPRAMPVTLDGMVLGYMDMRRMPYVIARLRAIKAARLAQMEPTTNPDAKLIEIAFPETEVPPDLEVVYMPLTHGGLYPGLFLYTSPGRLVRPVRQIGTGATELIGTQEQWNLNIRCPDGGPGGSPGMQHTHEELSATNILSVIASLTPYSDFNQSPRNMYQCQMAKQTMGTAVQAWPHRTDNKLYRLHTPQTPLARGVRYDKYHLDEFPNGTNAIVAVLAYTGYDMEDAMILNKASVDRGLCHGSIYKTETVDLREQSAVRNPVFGPDMGKTAAAVQRKRATRERPVGAFGQRFPQNVGSEPSSRAVRAGKVKAEPANMDGERLDVDGLPHVGAAIWPNQAYYSCHPKIVLKTAEELKKLKDAGQEDINGTEYKLGKLKGEEVGIIDRVTIVGGKERELQRVNIKMRINRNPVIGDKFASRHGQKGVLSQLWPDENMPYNAATGMRPDLIINPHAFPSRMTIGMLLESLGSKAGVLTGDFVDCSPFQAGDQGDAYEEPIKRFGDILESRGFARHGVETMVSGLTGEEFHMDIFIGPVYYQRLRHMVSDKFQVRSYGAVNPLTHQPIKGRKFGGGIRFGEMERDSLLAHGAAYLLHDRLHTCSDYTVLEVCSKCGSMLSPINLPAPAAATRGPAMLRTAQTATRRITCRLCDSGEYIEKVAIPFVFKYLVTELAAMNIRITLSMEHLGEGQQ